MEYAQLGVWGNIPWKYELNPVSVLGGDVIASLILTLLKVILSMYFLEFSNAVA